MCRRRQKKVLESKVYLYNALILISNIKLVRIVVSIYLGRRLLSVLTTVYIPSVLLNIIGHITNYFKPFYFESAIAVNLTVMLVLTSMFISVVAGLPVTSYIKMIDTWLLFSLVIPFIDVLLTCVIDNLRFSVIFL